MESKGAEVFGLRGRGTLRPVMTAACHFLFLASNL